MNALEVIDNSFEVWDAGMYWQEEGLGKFSPGDVYHANGLINGEHVWLEIDNRDNMCRVAFGDNPSSFPPEKVEPIKALEIIQKVCGC